MRIRRKSWVWTWLSLCGFVGPMSEDAEARRDIVRRLFYLITIAAEDAAAGAAEGQSERLSSDCAMASAASLRELGMRIEILSSAITKLLERGGQGG